MAYELFAKKQNAKCETALLHNRVKGRPAFTYSKLTIESLEQGVKYVQSSQ